MFWSARAEKLAVIKKRPTMTPKSYSQHRRICGPEAVKVIPHVSPQTWQCVRDSQVIIVLKAFKKQWRTLCARVRDPEKYPVDTIVEV